jgi:hypothetical protein
MKLMIKSGFKERSDEVVEGTDNEGAGDSDALGDTGGTEVGVHATATRINKPGTIRI